MELWDFPLVSMAENKRVIDCGLYFTLLIYTYVVITCNNVITTIYEWFLGPPSIRTIGISDCIGCLQVPKSSPRSNDSEDGYPNWPIQIGHPGQ